MTRRQEQLDAVVRRRERLSPHLVRLGLEAPGFETSGAPDEWVGLVVPGQFQSRYYTVRSWASGELVLDVVLHDVGLVTAWVASDRVGERVVVTEPKGSFDPPATAGWLWLVGDLTALPAMARIAESTALPTRIWAEVPDQELHEGYLPPGLDVSWLDTESGSTSRLAETVERLDWPPGEGYFWMAGESAQMRAIRRHLMRERRLPATAYDVMGYWRAAPGPARTVDPGPIWRAGRQAGLTDEEIWARYDEAQA